MYRAALGGFLFNNDLGFHYGRLVDQWQQVIPEKPDRAGQTDNQYDENQQFHVGNVHGVYSTSFGL
jgi:hypothetical protein